VRLLKGICEITGPSIDGSIGAEPAYEGHAILA
jgi:hypothetical protein